MKHKRSNLVLWEPREHGSTGYKILLQMEFQHLLELFDHVPSTSCFYNSDHFSSQFKTSNMLNLTRIIEMQLGVAAFLFWKIIVSSPCDMAIGECQIRNPVSRCFLPPSHEDAWSFVHTSFFFLFG